MKKMIIKRKLYSKYDDTDEIKRMKDSDILDAQEKKLNRLERIIRTLKNTGNKAIIGGVAGGALSLIGKNKSLDKTLRHAKLGAGIGAAGGLIQSVRVNNKEAEDTEFYNDRLRYAKKHARRRERSDWRNNMTQREGYSY